MFSRIFSIETAISTSFEHSTFSIIISYIKQDNVVEETMTVDAKHHRYFVAKRGEVLRNIGEEFGGVVVSFPRPGVTSDKVIE